MKRAWIAAATLLLSAACRTPVPPSLAPLPADDPRPRLVLDSWNGRTAARTALRAVARLAVDGTDEQVHIRGKQVLVVERPASLRVEVLGFLNQALAVLVTDGERFEVARAQDGSYETGAVDPLLLWNEARIALTPEEAAAVLLGAAAENDDWTVDSASSDGQGGLHMGLADPAGAVRLRVVFDRAGRLEDVERLGPEGEVVWRVHYADYRDVGGVPFAHTIRLDTRAGGTRAEIGLRDVELNPALPPDIFRLRGDGVTGGSG